MVILNVTLSEKNLSNYPYQVTKCLLKYVYDHIVYDQIIICDQYIIPFVFKYTVGIIFIFAYTIQRNQ